MYVVDMTTILTVSCISASWMPIRFLPAPHSSPPPSITSPASLCPLTPFPPSIASFPSLGKLSTARRCRALRGVCAVTPLSLLSHFSVLIHTCQRDTYWFSAFSRAHRRYWSVTSDMRLYSRMQNTPALFPIGDGTYPHARRVKTSLVTL